MGIFDSAKEQAEKLMEEHGDKIEQPSDQAFDRVAAEANERTGGQHAEHVDRARDMADSHVGMDDPVAAPVDQVDAVDPVDPAAER